MESNFTLVGVIRAAESLEKRRAGFCTRGLKAPEETAMCARC
jgi:hypothetical protein